MNESQEVSAITTKVETEGYTNLLKGIHNLVKRNISPDEKSKIVSAQIATYIAISTPAPQPGVNVNAWLRTGINAQVMDLISRINEEIAIDVDEAFSLSNSVLLALHKQDTRRARFNRIMGVSEPLLPKDTLDILKSTKTEYVISGLCYTGEEGWY